MSKPKLTSELLELAVRLKKDGANDKDIAAALCVAPQTFSRWVNHPQTALQSELCEALKKAEADYKNSLLTSIKLAGEKDWRALCWLLERKYPSEYGRVDRLQAEVSAKHAGGIKVTHMFSYSD